MASHPSFFFFSPQFENILNFVFNPELVHLLFHFQNHSLKLYGWFFLFQSVPFTKCMSRLLFHASFIVAGCTKISSVSLASLLILLHCRFSEAFLCTDSLHVSLCFAAAPRMPSRLNTVLTNRFDLSV